MFTVKDYQFITRVAGSQSAVNINLHHCILLIDASAYRTRIRSLLSARASLKDRRLGRTKTQRDKESR